MQVLLDHDVPADIGRVLAQAEHEVFRVMDVLHPTALMRQSLSTLPFMSLS